jgi:hypothetical protein
MSIDEEAMSRKEEDIPKEKEDVHQHGENG